MILKLFEVDVSEDIVVLFIESQLVEILATSLAQVSDIDRWFALIRIWSPWLAPRQGKSRFDLDKEAVMCSFLSLTGKHLVLLAISGVEDVMTLFTSDPEGNVILHVRLGRGFQ